MDERAEGEAVAPGGRHVGDADPLVAVGGSPRPHLQGLGAAVLHDGCSSRLLSAGLPMRSG